MDQDRQSAIRGLPQRIGKRGSIAVAALLVLIAALIIF
jgi:1,4-dihydroxy-2-naphthoate octaprenyltransferase